MSWATPHIETLKAGVTAKFRPHGNSMMPRIKSGALCTVSPATSDAVRIGDVVLCRVRGYNYLHLVKATEMRGGKQYVLIGNNKGGINGWTSTVYGRLEKVEP